MGQQAAGAIATESEAAEFIKDLAAADKRVTDTVTRVEYEARRKERAKKLRSDLRFHPESHIAAAIRAMNEETEEEQKKDESLTVTTLGTMGHDWIERLTVTADFYREPKSIIAKYEELRGGMSEATMIALWTHELAARTMAEDRLRGRQLWPTELEAFYGGAVEASAPNTAPIIEVIEAARDHLADCVRECDPLRQPEQLHALRQLQERIRQERESRVPAVFQQALEAAQAAKRRASTLTATRKIALVSRHELSEARGKFGVAK